MRILFISGYFPPKAPIGAVRPGKLAEYWRESGHDVRVVAVALASQSWAHEQSSCIEAHYVGYTEPGQFVTRIKSAVDHSPISAFRTDPGSKRPALNHELQAGNGEAISKGGRGLTDIYRQVLCLPDRYRSWIRPAARFARSWRREWQADLIYSSGPPNSGHIVASKLAREFGTPWIAEIRDAWLANSYGGPHWLIKPFFNRQVRRTLRNAAGIVAVTNADRLQMAANFPAPVVLSYNGFDPRDFPNLDTPEPLDRERLTILHAGVIYPGRRDPTPLFKAISALGAQSGKVRCLFYGDDTGSVAPLAEACGVGAQVETGGVLRRSQILSLERAVDVLLECHWQHSAGDGVIPGKLFEYIGARRPILSLGSTSAEAAVIVRENGVGLASNDPEEIRVALLDWLAQKSRFGRLPDLATSADMRFERQYQFRIIDELIQNLVRESRPASRSARKQAAAL